jgi:hypothetical protein
MKRRIALAVFALLLMVAPLGIVAGSTVTGALYNMVITVGNVGTAATNVATVCTLSTPNLIAGGYANAGATNIALQSSTGTDIPFMPGNAANPMVLFVPSIGASEYQQDLLYLANSSGGDIVYFPGATGMNILDNAALEPAANAFLIDIEGYFIGTNSGAARYILLKAAAINIYYAAAVDNRILADVWPGPVTMTINNVTTGHGRVSLSSDGVNMTLAAYDNTGALIDSNSVAAVNVTDTANHWIFAQNPAMLYMDYVRYNVAGAALCYWDWEYGATFTDNVSAVVATPTFRTTTSDADVTASAGEFTIIDPAEASGAALASPSDWYGTPSITGSTFTTGTVTPTFPGASVITAIATATSTPNNLPLTIITGVIILIASLAVSTLMRRGGSGSLIIKMVLIGGLLGVAVATQIFDLWMPIVFLIMAGALAMGSQQRGWN